MYYDIHSHLNHQEFLSSGKLDEVVKDVHSLGMLVNCVGYSLLSSSEAVMLAEQNPNVYAVVGVHPDEVYEFDEFELKRIAGSDKVVGIGECGFDYFRVDRVDVQDKQDRVFRSHIEIALDKDLPLMLHIRPTGGTFDAYEDALRVLDEYVDEGIRANFHFFAGDVGILKEVLDRGFYVSFTGVVTYGDNYDEVLKEAPIERIMVETDAPWVAPVPHRGELCVPSMVEFVVKRIAEVKELDSGDVENVVFRNSVNFFLEGKGIKV